MQFCDYIATGRFAIRWVYGGYTTASTALFCTHTFGNFQHQASVFELIEGWSHETVLTKNKHHCYVFVPIVGKC